MSRVQVRLIVALAVPVAVVVLAWGYVAERDLRARELARVERSLEKRAQLVGELVSGTPISVAERAGLEAVVQRAARAAGARVTLIDRAGTVVADSGVPSAELDQLENRGDQPEVRAALEGRLATDVRPSPASGRPFFYLAVPAGRLGLQGALRLGVAIDAIEGDVAELRRGLLAVGALGLGLSVALAFAVSTLLMRPVRELSRAVVSIARGDLDQRLSWPDREELGEIAAAVNELDDQLRRRLRRVTDDKEQLQAVLASMDEGVLVLDREARLVMANPRLRELLDLRRDVVGRPHWEVIRRVEVDEILQSAAHSERALESEFTLSDSANRALHMHAARLPTRGPLLGVVAVFRDVTELRRLERMRRDFVANVSHELKTPLTAIRGFAETLLADREIPERQRDSYLRVILRNADRLRSLIEDILELSRIESGKIGLERGDVDLARLAAEVIRDLKPQLEARELVADHHCQGDPVAWADRSAVAQILTNLLDNAIKYTEPGGRVEVRVSGGTEEVRVDVTDTGIGIPEADRSRIFERFYRVDKARSRDVGGTGLGLSIVKHLTQLLGGEVTVQSQLGRGSTFTLRLPRRSP